MMKTRFRNLGPLLGLAVLPSLFLAGCASVLPGRGDGDKAAENARIDFESQIRPILENKCLSCHNGGETNRNVNLETLERANNSWRGGPVIVKGQPEWSMLYQVLATEPDAAGGAQPHLISYAQRQLIYQWIEEDAPWPADGPPLQAPGGD